MEFKVGEKVRIKNNLKEIKNFVGMYVDDLEKYVGKIITIKEFVCCSCAIRCKENDWNWDIRALEKIELTLDDLKFGDILTLRNNEKYVYAYGYVYGESEDYSLDYHYIRNYYNDNLSHDKNIEYDIVEVKRNGEVI